MKKFIAAAVLIATSTGVGLAQDIEKGATVFKQCQVCHSIGPGAKNKIGPELNGLDGRAAGTVPNFDYSMRTGTPALFGTKRTSRNM